MTKAPHLLLVVAPYYEHLSALLREGAERAVAAAGATCETVTVPGARLNLEIDPIARYVARLLETRAGLLEAS